MLVDPDGYARPVDPDAVASLFAALPTKPKWVILNACYSRVLAAKLAEHVECVIGMSRAIGDAAALRFAEGFYRAIAYGNNARTAFDLGCARSAWPACPTRSCRTSRPAGRSTPRMSAEPDIPRNWLDVEPGTGSGRLGGLLFTLVRHQPATARHPRHRVGVRLASDDQQLHYGTCHVAVPRSHRIGSVGSPFSKRWLTCTDDLLRLVRLERLAEADFWTGVPPRRWPTGETLTKTAVVFVHGFNVNFNDAACRDRTDRV